MEGRALADLMIVIPKRSRHTGKECSQPPFAIDQRQNAQIFAVKKQQVEQEDGQGSMGAPSIWPRIKPLKVALDE
jgi:hypothetical protein